MDTNEHELLTPDDVVAEWKIPKPTLYRWRTTGYGPPALRVGKHLRYRRSDLEGWLASQTDSPRPAA